MFVSAPTDYENEAGFLTNFSANEKALIKPVTHKYLISGSGEKENRAQSAGFAIGGTYNMLEQYGFETSLNTSKLLTTYLPHYKGIHSGNASSENKDEYWVDMLTNINNVRGNNFGEAYFDSTAFSISPKTIEFPKINIALLITAC